MEIARNPDVWTPLHQEMMHSIDLLYQASPAPAQPEADPIRRSIIDILGPESIKKWTSVPPAPSAPQAYVSGHWWRMYINRKDHRKAREKAPDDPGSLYDREYSPGFKKCMTLAYIKYLQPREDRIAQFDKAFKEGKFKFDPGYYKELTYKDYQEMFDVTNASTDHHLTVDPRIYTVFTIDGNVAADMAEYGYCNLHLVDPDPIWGDIKYPSVAPVRRSIAYSIEAGVYHQTYDMEGRKSGINADDPCIVGWGRKDWPAIIDAMFQEYHKGYGQARTRLEQLEAIARLVRNLHVAHMYSDGNGRLNINTLLPMLLLWNGFGLPLGGRNRGNLSPRAWEYLCGGAWTVNEMAKYLWVAQDFGIAGAPADTLLSETAT